MQFTNIKFLGWHIHTYMQLQFNSGLEFVSQFPTVREGRALMQCRLGVQRPLFDGGVP